MSDITLTNNNFNAEVLQSNMPVLVDFWAPWCGPCKIVGPIVEVLAEEYAGRMKVCKLNVDENTDSAGRYNVMSIPTLMVFKNGQVVKTMVGAQSKENIKKGIDEVLTA